MDAWDSVFFTWAHFTLGLHRQPATSLGQLTFNCQRTRDVHQVGRAYSRAGLNAVSHPPFTINHSLSKNICTNSHLIRKYLCHSRILSLTPRFIEGTGRRPMNPNRFQRFAAPLPHSQNRCQWKLGHASFLCYPGSGGQNE